MILAEAFAECENQVYATRAVNTARSYKNAFKVLTQFFSDQNIDPDQSIDSVTMEYFIKFPGWLAQNNYSKRTIGVYLSGAKFFLDWLVIRGTLKPDYSETIRYQMAIKQINRKRESRLPRTPEKGAVERIVDVLNQLNLPSPRRERNIALILFLMTTGCRNNEVVQLRIKDIDLQAHTAVVVGKGNKERKVFFNSGTADALELYWKVRGYTDKKHPAFARHDKGTGKRISKITTTSVRKIVDEVSGLAGLSKGTFTPHYFRHAFAIKMLHETHDLALVQDLLGHASPTSTRVYAKIYPEELENAHRKVWESSSNDELIKEDDSLTKS
jgi:site-specific recombinase XerD